MKKGGCEKTISLRLTYGCPLVGGGVRAIPASTRRYPEEVATLPGAPAQTKQADLGNTEGAGSLSQQATTRSRTSTQRPWMEAAISFADPCTLGVRSSLEELGHLLQSSPV